MDVSILLPIYVLSVSVAIIAAILSGLNSAATSSNWSSQTKSRTIVLSALILVGWFALAILLAYMGVYRGTVSKMPTIQYGMLIPIVIGSLLIWRSASVAQILNAIPQHWLVGVQFYRALGIIFLVLYAYGALPGLFAWPAGLGDVLVGAIAPIVAISYLRNPRQSGDLVVAWNWFGILDLIVATTTGFLTTPSPLHLFSVDLPNNLISAFPLVLIPTYLVPLSILLHIASLVKERRTKFEFEREQKTDLPNSRILTSR